MSTFFSFPFFFVDFYQRADATQSNEILMSISLVFLEYPVYKCGGNCFIDVEKMKLRSALKQMDVGHCPITSDDIIVRDHFFRDPFAVKSY